MAARTLPALTLAAILLGSLAVAVTSASRHARPGCPATLDPCRQADPSPPSPSAPPTLSATPTPSPSVVASPVATASPCRRSPRHHLAPAVASPPPARASTAPSPMSAPAATSDCTAVTLVPPSASPAPPVATAPTRATAPASRKPGRVRERLNVPFMERQACAESRAWLRQPGRHLLPRQPGPVAGHRHPPRSTAHTLGHGGAGRDPRRQGCRRLQHRLPRCPAREQGLSGVDLGRRLRRSLCTPERRADMAATATTWSWSATPWAATWGPWWPSPATRSRAPGARCRSSLGMKASLPNGFVSVAGVSEIHRDYHIDQVFLGGTYAADPGRLAPGLAVHPYRSTHGPQPSTQGGHHLRAP